MRGLKMDEIKKEQPAEQEFKFRKSMGGFKKEDVVKYISEENRKFAEERAALQTRLDEEIAKSEAAAKKSSELQLYYELLLKKRAEEIAEKDAALTSASASSADSEKVVAEAVAAAKAEAEAKIAELSEKCSGLEGKLAEAENREPERDTAKEDALSAELEEAKAAAEALKAELEAAKTEAVAAKAELETVKAENEALKAECEDLKAKYEEALAAVPVTDDEAVDQLKALNEELEAKNEELQAKCDEFKAEFDALKEESENAVPNEEAKGSFENDTPVTAREFARQRETSCGFQKTAAPCGTEAPQKKIGAFDQRSDEVSDSISTLLEEIAYRCRLLAAYIKIGAEKDEVAKKIDSEFKNK